MQKTVELKGRHCDGLTNLSELDELLLEGWKVSRICPYGEPVAGSQHTSAHGSFGVLVIVEKETDEK